MKKQILTALLAAAMLSPAVYATGAHAAAHPAPSVQPAKAKGIWIDVRTPEEYQEGHLADAVNIPHDQIANKISATAADKNAPIHLYCKSGRRAGLAKQQLEKMGYTNVSNHGGYQDLLAKGMK